MTIQHIQAALRDVGLDGWLFYDFRGSDPLGAKILGLSKSHRTRRWFYFLPAEGEPTGIVHAIEAGALDELPGKKRVYLPWQQLQQTLGETLEGSRRIAMQYSPGNAIPYVSRVDAGTVELVRSFGVEIVSSADLVQRFEAVLDDEQEAMHHEAADKLAAIMTASFEEIARQLAAGGRPTEFGIQSFIAEAFSREGLVTDHPPIVAVNAHAADPHFAPSSTDSASIGPGDFVLIDMWAKCDKERSIFADITWNGFVGDQIPDKIEKVFRIVAQARDAALEAIRQAQSAGRPILGCDVDDICRKVIADAGYGERFIHRTGHSIHETGHGNGANLDNLETRDERRLIPRTCFSIEPGIYLPGEFGIRSEIDVYLPDERTVVVSGAEPQRQIVRVGG